MSTHRTDAGSITPPPLSRPTHWLKWTDARGGEFELQRINYNQAPDRWYEVVCNGHHPWEIRCHLSHRQGVSDLQWQSRASGGQWRALTQSNEIFGVNTSTLGLLSLPPNTEYRLVVS